MTHIQGFRENFQLHVHVVQHIQQCLSVHPQLSPAACRCSSSESPDSMQLVHRMWSSSLQVKGDSLNRGSHRIGNPAFLILKQMPCPIIMTNYCMFFASCNKLMHGPRVSLHIPRLFNSLPKFSIDLNLQLHLELLDYNAFLPLV